MIACMQALGVYTEWTANSIVSIAAGYQILPTSGAAVASQCAPNRGPYVTNMHKLGCNGSGRGLVNGRLYLQCIHHLVTTWAACIIAELSLGLFLFPESGIPFLVHQILDLVAVSRPFLQTNFPFIISWVLVQFSQFIVGFESKRGQKRSKNDETGT